MITRSQVSKIKEDVGLRRSVRLINKQAKKQVIKEEHQRRVEAKKKARVQKKKAAAGEVESKCRAAAGPFGPSGPHGPTGRRRRQAGSHRGQTGRRRSRAGPQALAGQAGPYDQAGPHSSQVSVKLPRSEEDMKESDGRGSLNRDEDLCDCLDQACPGCFNTCSECHSTKCFVICHHKRDLVYEATSNEDKEVVGTFVFTDAEY
ncbi:ARL14 effector protein-like [Trichosurus vulpecula]|uniref:ARL14 effector protein-like n=1 Tax=Trichosurus vulpecula TaxID=9337 RepID=UPI00186B2C7B|nr:ARL14 effector protein-like [Trichosurus vulpecula]